jgi:hypothetical protein
MNMQSPLKAPVLPKPGIYFGMDEEIYHRAPALSSTGIRNLLISPLDYWAMSHFNPDYVDDKTDAMIAGTAFHRRLLEPEKFQAIYAKQPQREDYPDAIDGGKALQAECERLGLRKSGAIPVMCERILDADATAKLWPVIEQGLLANLGDRTLLKPSLMEDIERAARLVFAYKDTSKALTGGRAEVSVFWIDEETGVPLKARIDYLKVKAIIDVKSFSNPLGKPVDAAIASAVANSRYDVQAVMYDAAVDAAKRMMRTHKMAAIFGADGIPNEWLVGLAACERHTFAFLFIEQGAVTNVKLREFRKFETYGRSGMTANMYWQSGHAGFRRGVELYALYASKFKPGDPWIQDEPMKAFSDQDFPLYMFQGN